MNSDLKQLFPYPFEQLKGLLQDLTPPPEKRPVKLYIGEPQHAAPTFVNQSITDNLHYLSGYPLTRGSEELRCAIANWLKKRFLLPDIDADRQILPVNGTREGLFAFTQTCIDRNRDATVFLPNPFYQIYEGAALLAGARPQYLNCTADTGYLPDFDSITAEQWQQCQMLTICTPGNPAGAVIPLERLQHLAELACEHNFILVSDECYSEIYPDESAPPPGLLQACIANGNDSYQNCVVFHSLSKRSNLPGLRSGFAAGDATILAEFLRYRTYHGSAMPLHHQLASCAAWSDEQHVLENRQLYRDKFDAVLAVLSNHLPVGAPEAGFYLWARTPVSDITFTRELYARQGITVLPGRYLARESNGINPGENHVRLALVAPLENCVQAAEGIVEYLNSAG